MVARIPPARSLAARAALLAALGACSASPPASSPRPDATPDWRSSSTDQRPRRDAPPPARDAAPADAPRCAPHASSACHANAVYWIDSCGAREELKQACAAPQTCLGGACCRPAQTTGSFTLPAHTIWVEWKLPSNAIATLEFPLRIVNDPGSTVGLYLAPFSGSVDGTQFYFGLQSDVFQPGVGGVGKGLLFSRWGTQSAADLRTAPGGFSEIGAHEGQFVGVRRRYAWGQGDYTVRLRRTTADGAQDWFALSIRDAAGKETAIGELRFPRAKASVRASIAGAGTTFTEVYAHATSYDAVPRWHTAIIARADGAPPTAARVDYPAWPTAEFPNADAYRDPADGMLHLIFGGSTRRCHDPGLVIP